MTQTDQHAKNDLRIQKALRVALTLLASYGILVGVGASPVQAYSVTPVRPDLSYWNRSMQADIPFQHGTNISSVDTTDAPPVNDDTSTVWCSNPIGRIITDTLTSNVLAQDLPVNVYLPPCYDGSRFDYPTLYLIQGSGFVQGEWIVDGATRLADLQMSLGMLAPFIIVMPANDLNSGDSGVYINSSGGAGSWEDFIVNDLVPYIDTKYSTWNDRRGRAIGGISRGGYWSLQIAFSHPDLFTVVGGHSPAIASMFLNGVGDGFSMLSMAKSIDSMKTLRIFLDAGDQDEMQPGMLQLAEELLQHGIPYAKSIGTGIHDDRYWSSRMSDYLTFYAADWPMVARTKSQATWQQSFYRFQ